MHASPFRELLASWFLYTSSRESVHDCHGILVEPAQVPFGAWHCLFNFNLHAYTYVHMMLKYKSKLVHHALTSNRIAPHAIHQSTLVCHARTSSNRIAPHTTVCHALSSSNRFTSHAHIINWAVRATYATSHINVAS